MPRFQTLVWLDMDLKVTMTTLAQGFLAPEVTLLPNTLEQVYNHFIELGHDHGAL